MENIADAIGSLLVLVVLFGIAIWRGKQAKKPPYLR